MREIIFASHTTSPHSLRFQVMKIYTRTGDSGMTSLAGGRRIAKDSLRVEAYGSIDTLNSHIAVLWAQSPWQEIRSQLQEVSNRLFDLGGYLATPADAPAACRVPVAADVEALEKAIDAMDAQLKPLHTFILPLGVAAAAAAQVARTAARTAERRMLSLHSVEPLEPLALAWINRLSDYLFTLARYINHLCDMPEVPWQKS